MSIHSHARCDQCERLLVPMAEQEEMTEDSLLFAGWVCVKWFEGDEEEGVDYTRDFCSRVCAGRWLTKETTDGEEAPRLHSSGGEDR